jgi:hypothetical protein
MPQAARRGGMGSLFRAVLATSLLAFLLAALPAAASASGVVQMNRETYLYSSTLPLAQEANSYQVMVLQQTDAAKVPLLKAANPGLKILVYQAIMAATKVSQSSTTCTSGTSDAASNPAWIMKDQNGSLVSGAANDYLMDVGSPGYQQACTANAIATAKKDGFDGVFWDMANASLVWTLPSGVTVPEYPSNTAWQAGMYSMLSYAGAQIHAAGLLNVANIGGSSTTAGLWQQWNGPLDGAEEEGFTDYGTGLAMGVWAWPKQVANFAWSQANGKFVVVHSWNNTEAGNSYGIASMLLVAAGTLSYSTSNSCYSNCEIWYPEYAQAQQLGNPSGSYIKLANGAYERWFANGVVVVNPTSTAIGSFALGGGTYSGSQLSHVSSVSLPATSGYVLVADAGTSAIAPTSASAPVISGTPTIGGTLSAGTGGWSGSPAPTFAYQWSRCASGACTPISGATGQGYTVQTADVGASLEVSETATNSAGTGSATSAWTAGVAPASAPTFTLTASVVSATVNRGSTQWFVVTIHPQNGFKSSVAFSVTGVPNGGKGFFIPVTTFTSTTLVVTTSSTSVGTWPIKITGTGGGQTVTIPVTLTVK